MDQQAGRLKEKQRLKYPEYMFGLSEEQFEQFRTLDHSAGRYCLCFAVQNHNVIAYILDINNETEIPLGICDSEDYLFSIKQEQFLKFSLMKKHHMQEYTNSFKEFFEDEGSKTLCFGYRWKNGEVNVYIGYVGTDVFMPVGTEHIPYDLTPNQGIKP